MSARGRIRPKAERRRRRTAARAVHWGRVRRRRLRPSALLPTAIDEQLPPADPDWTPGGPVIEDEDEEEDE
jgi:hypothetical protein